MEFLTGLKEQQELLDAAKTARGSGEKKESSFIKLQDGESITINFLQELDTDGKFYDEERGLAVSVFEHGMPVAPYRRFICTLPTEGRCVGCEKSVINSRWKKKPRMYSNVYVKEQDAVKILPAGFSNAGVAEDIIEFAKDFGTLCDRWYKFRRIGEKLDTKYNLYPKEVTSVDFSQHELITLENVLKTRTYEEVSEWVGGGENKENLSW